MKLLGTGEKAKISIFMIWFCLNSKVAEEKIYTGVASPDSRELCKVSPKSELSFPIEPTKIL